MADVTKDGGKIVICMEKGNTNGKTVGIMKETTIMIKNMGMASTDGLVIHFYIYFKP